MRRNSEVRIWSLPTRGAWIEINQSKTIFPLPRVAPHAGSVDRNSLGTKDSYGVEQVAPHAGSVDRNIIKSVFDREMGNVAPHAGSVDRNIPEFVCGILATSRSPRGERG